MRYKGVILGENVNIDPTSFSSINNVIIEDNVKIAKLCSIYGSERNPLQIGKNAYVGMHSILNGYSAQLKIGSYVSIAQKVNIMTDSGPNASEVLQKIFPIEAGEVCIGDHSWIGASVVIMPGVTIGKYCVVAANSFVNTSFPDYSVIGGTPARLIRQLSENEIEKMNQL